MDKTVATNSKVNSIFHCNRDFQCTSKIFQKKHEMEQSMSCVGHYIDNGLIEGFQYIIKSDMYQIYMIIIEATLRFAIKDYTRLNSVERSQDRYHRKIPLKFRNEILSLSIRLEYPIVKK